MNELKVFKFILKIYNIIMNHLLNIYTDDNLSHYVIINKELPMNIDYLNVYIIFYILAFKILKRSYL